MIKYNNKKCFAYSKVDNGDQLKQQPLLNAVWTEGNGRYNLDNASLLKWLIAINGSPFQNTPGSHLTSSPEWNSVKWCQVLELSKFSSASLTVVGLKYFVFRFLVFHREEPALLYAGNIHLTGGNDSISNWYRSFYCGSPKQTQKQN